MTRVVGRVMARRGFCWAGALSMLALACGAGSTKLLGVPVKRPIALVFRATPEFAAKSDPRGMYQLADLLTQGLKDKGLVGYVPAEGQAAPPPRLELVIRRWDGEGAMSPSTASAVFGPAVGIASGLAHARDVEVECAVVREGDTAPADRYVFTAESGDAMASDILNHVFTDKSTIERPKMRGAHGGP